MKYQFEINGLNSKYKSQCMQKLLNNKLLLKILKIFED